MLDRDKLAAAVKGVQDDLKSPVPSLNQEQIDAEAERKAILRKDIEALDAGTAPSEVVQRRVAELLLRQL